MAMSDSREPDLPSATRGSRFPLQLAVATMALFLLWLILFILEKFQVILQPLFIAVFLGYIILPVHRWLVSRGVPAFLAIALILVLFVGSFVGLGMLAYSNADAVIERLPAYRARLDSMLDEGLKLLPMEAADAQKIRRRVLEAITSPEQVTARLQAVVGGFLEFFTGMAVTFIYLLFLIAEKITFPRRMLLAFGQTEGNHVLQVVDSINLAIGEYLAVKVFISFLAGVLSLIVLWAFQVDFFVMWAILIFVLNFIPYFGSLVAIAFPILVSFLQTDNPATALAVTALLVAIQVVLGNFVEPRMAGRRLGVSPLLILLALSFWGVIWGIVGMILAVPLLVSIKIVLENIKATRPLATLMSNI